MFLTDTLLRLPISSNVSKVPTVDMLQINSLEEFAERDSLLQEIAYHQDSEINLLKRYITNGLPRHLPSNMLPYTKAFEEYTIQSGIVYRGCRIVPAKSFRQRIMSLLHHDHPGIVRMIRLARQYFWWPDIDSSINAFVLRCATCQIHARKRTNLNLKSWEEAVEVFERVHIDVAHYCEKKIWL